MIPLGTGYTNMKNLIGLIEAICDTYDRNDLSPLSDGTTFCNVGVWSVASYMGCKDLVDKTADQMMEIFSTSSSWSEVPMEKAQDMANDGSLIIAGLDSKSLGQSHGHVTVVRPGVPCYSGKWGKVPRILNIGAENYIARAKRGPAVGMAVGVNEAFVPLPKFYVWRPSLG